MSLTEMGIEHRTFENALAATIPANVKSRDQVLAIVQRLGEAIPGEYVAGSPFCIFQFISSYEEGFDAEIGMPVTHVVESGEPNDPQQLKLGGCGL